MQPRLEELVQHLTTTREEFHAVILAVPEPRRGITTTPGIWSINEVVHHVARIEAMAMKALWPALDTAREQGIPAETETSSVLGMVKGERMKSRVRKVNSPEAGLPRFGISASEALEELADARVALLEFLRSADGLALSQVAAPHPIIGELNAYQWIAFLGYHDLRHADQIREIDTGLPS